jgi:Zn-dependent protease with chaperone function
VAAERSLALVGMMAWHHMPLPLGGTPSSGETLPLPPPERPFSIRMSSGLSADTTTATMFPSALFSFLPIFVIYSEHDKLVRWSVGTAIRMTAKVCKCGRQRVLVMSLARLHGTTRLLV